MRKNLNILYNIFFFDKEHILNHILHNIYMGCVYNFKNFSSNYNLHLEKQKRQNLS
jgi:hypothetical protein